MDSISRIALPSSCASCKDVYKRQTIITALVAVLTYKPLKRYWLAEDLAK